MSLLHSSRDAACRRGRLPVRTAAGGRCLFALVAGILLLGSVPPALPDSLQVIRQGEYTLLSGGLDEAEVAELTQLMPRYQIQLVFRRADSKEGLTGVHVRLRNTAGELVVETVTRGPWLYVNPPAGGRYTVEAEHAGETLTRTRDLTGRRYLQLEFTFGAGAANP